MNSLDGQKLLILLSKINIKVLPLQNYVYIVYDLVSLEVAEGNDDLPPSLVVLRQVPADHLRQPHDVPDFLNNQRSTCSFSLM